MPSYQGRIKSTAAYRCIFYLKHRFNTENEHYQHIDIHRNKFAPVDPDNVEVEDTDKGIVMETPEDVNDKDQNDLKDPLPCIQRV